MKSLFIVGAKLVGIWIAIGSFLPLLMAFSFLFSLEEGELSNWLVTYIPYNLPGIMAGLFLVFKTNWLAGIVGLKDDDSTIHLSSNERTMLSVGIRLLGLFLFFTNISLVVTLFRAWFANLHPLTMHNVIRNAVQIWIYLLPLYLIFGWRRITDILDRPAKEKKTQEATSEA